jgi:SAM-dependent methyltransferase
LLTRGSVPWPAIYRTLHFPMDSTRYFEFEAAGRFVPDAGVLRYLDVSSPRLFPLGLLRAHPGWTADLLNPDASDLAETRLMVDALGLAERCALQSCAIDRAPFPGGSFDLVTCISVLEHIPDDLAAVRAMWRLLKPGGRLVLTVPCAAHESEQYIDRDQYGVLQPDAAGNVFWQRFYDDARLDRQVFSVTGPPARRVVYGEREAGAFQRNAERKRADPLYPLWREPLMMAREYGLFPSIAALPGEGVVALEIVKA